MSTEPDRTGWAKLIALKLVCCGGLLLFATGVLTLNGVGAWLLDGGLSWLVPAGVLALAVLLLWRRRNSHIVARHESPGRLPGARAS